MSNLNIRKLNASDYEDILVYWWGDWGWTPPERDFLPDNGEGGMIVFDGETPVCAGFVYVTNSSVCWVDWIISSRTYIKKPSRKEAIKMLIHTLTNLCKNTGSKYAYALIKSQNLISTYEDLGYVKGDSYSSEMIKLL